MNDLSVLSPNLKSYLDPNFNNNNNNNNIGGRSQRIHDAHHYEQHVVARDAIAVNNGHPDAVDIHSPIYFHQSRRSQEEEVYSPHLAALSSPSPLFRYEYNYNIHPEDDGLLHSIFSAKKLHRKKKKMKKQRRSFQRNGKLVHHKGGEKVDKEKKEDDDDDDVLGLFSPGTHEFDLDEALADVNYGDGSDASEPSTTDNNSHQMKQRGGGGDRNEDEMTLDSVDRIVRGDYLKCRQSDGKVVSDLKIVAAAAAMTFTSPTGAAAAAVVRTVSMTTTPVIDNTVKTPTYSTPYNNNYNNNNEGEDTDEYFYTPAQEKSQRGYGSLTSSSSLAPVWETNEEMLLYEERHAHNDEVAVVPSSSSSLKSLVFQTPMEYSRGYNDSVDRRQSGVGRVRWNMEEQEEEEEEFFSPLAEQHCAEMRSSNQQQQQQRVTLENERYNDTIIEERKNTNLMESLANEMGGTNQYQQQPPRQQQQNVTSSPPMASPKYSEMREELQQMLAEAKRLTPRKEEKEAVVPPPKSSSMNQITLDNANDDKENVHPTATTSPEPARTNVNHTNNAIFDLSSAAAITTGNYSPRYSPPQTTPNSHHHHLYHHQSHSSSTTSLPPEQLTLDFVKQCDCLDTLKEILSRLSSEDYDIMSNIYGSDDDDRGKKQLKYPSMVRYVEKRIKIVSTASAAAAEEDGTEMMEREHQVGDPVRGSGEVGSEGTKKENVFPVEHHQCSDETNDAFNQEGGRSVHPSLETSSLSQSPREERGEEVVDNNEWSMHHRHRQITPENQSIEERSESIMTHETSLDMNLSESLDDESFFWRQGGDGQQEQVASCVSQPVNVAEKFDEDEPLDASNEQDLYNDVAIAPSAPQEEHFTPPESYAELQEKLTSSLAAHAQLTERVDQLIKEHVSIKAELTSKLDQAREQLAQRQCHASAEKEEYNKQVSQLMQVNQTLEQEMSSLKGRLEVVNQKAIDAASQAELQLNQTRLTQAKLLKENDKFGKELDEARLARDQGAAEVRRLKQMLDERVASADTNDNVTNRIKKGLDAAKFANHALANALAISEKDLSEALHQKEMSARECNSLRERIAELEDKSSWLSSKVKEMTIELESSHKYIDTLYADIKSNRSPSKEMKAELERKEMQWLELEHQYTRRIQELEHQIAGQSGASKVSMADYVVAVRESRKHQSETVQKQKEVDELESTISSLKQQIEAMRRRPSPRNGISVSTTSRGKSISSMRHHGKKVHNESSAGIENDENKAPLSEQRGRAASGEVGGKKMRRMTALKAVGGRKGLSEQLRRARRAGGEE